MAVSAKEALYGKTVENIIGLKKINLRPFKLNRVYLEPLNLTNVGYFPWR